MTSSFHGIHGDRVPEQDVAQGPPELVGVTAYARARCCTAPGGAGHSGQQSVITTPVGAPPIGGPTLSLSGRGASNWRPLKTGPEQDGAHGGLRSLLA